MKRRNADCSKIRRLPKRSKITEGFYGRYNFSIFNMAAILIIILKEWILFLLSGPFLYLFASAAREKPFGDQFYNVDCKRWRLLMVYDNEEMNRRLFLDVCEHKCLFAVFSGLLFDRESNRINHEADKNQRIYILFLIFVSATWINSQSLQKIVSVLLSDWTITSDNFEIIYLDFVNYLATTLH